MASVLLNQLAAGETVEQIVENYPTVNREAVLTAVAYAAELARERTIGLATV